MGDEKMRGVIQVAFVFAAPPVGFPEQVEFKVQVLAGSEREPRCRFLTENTSRHTSSRRSAKEQSLGLSPRCSEPS